MRQHEAVVQFGAPAHEALRRVRLAPETHQQGAQQKLLDERHARVRRHLEAAHFEQAEASRRAVGRIQLVDAEFGAVRVARSVDQQIAQHAVDQPGRDRRAGPRQLAKGQFEFVDRVVARLVHARRLAGRADEEAGEEIGQRRMVEPVADQAAQQVGPAQEGRVERRRRAEDEVVAAAGTGVAPVEHELLAAQARLAGRVVEMHGALDELAPARAGLDVHLDDAGVGRDAEVRQARIGRRLVALDDQADAERLGARFDRGDEFEIVVETVARRHEDVEHAVACLRRHGGAHDPGGRLPGLRRPFGGVFAGGGGARPGRVGRALRSRRTQRPAGDRRAALGQDRGVRRQRREGRARIGRIDVGIVAPGHPRLRIERQAVTERRVAGNQVAAFAAQEPWPALPAPAGRVAR